MALISPGSLRVSLHRELHFSLRNPTIKSRRKLLGYQCFPGNRWGSWIANSSDKNKSSQGGSSSTPDEEINNLGVTAALTLLRFYKREISPLLPKSCRYVPTCSEYSMIAFKKYGFVKGTVLTACRLCRCNPLGSSGFDPPRWFDEPSPPQQ